MKLTPNGSAPTRRLPRSVPPLAVLAGAALVQHSIPVSRTSRTPATWIRRSAAAGIAATSATLLVSSVRAFRARATTVDPRTNAQPSALVTDGPNRLTRNPMYVAMAGLLVANALHRGRGVHVLPAAGFVLWIDRTQIPQEEATLLSMFGETFHDYTTSTPRWVGPILTKDDRR